MIQRVYIGGINPEPWTAPELSVARRGGKTFPQAHKSMRLRAYQESIIETVAPLDLSVVAGPIDLEFYFWRNLEPYEINGKKRRRHRADVTNLQKALEDALQGLLFANDNQVVRTRSTMAKQEADIEPGILIVQYAPASPLVPNDLLLLRDAGEDVVVEVE